MIFKPLNEIRDATLEATFDATFNAIYGVTWIPTGTGGATIDVEYVAARSVIRDMLEPATYEFLNEI